MKEFKLRSLPQGANKGDYIIPEESIKHLIQDDVYLITDIRNKMVRNLSDNTNLFTLPWIEQNVPLGYEFNMYNFSLEENQNLGGIQYARLPENNVGEANDPKTFEGAQIKALVFSDVDQNGLSIESLYTEEVQEDTIALLVKIGDRELLCPYMNNEEGMSIFMGSAIMSYGLDTSTDLSQVEIGFTEVKLEDVLNLKFKVPVKKEFFEANQLDIFHYGYTPLVPQGVQVPDLEVIESEPKFGFSKSINLYGYQSEGSTFIQGLDTIFMYILYSYIQKGIQIGVEVSVNGEVLEEGWASGIAPIEDGDYLEIEVNYTIPGVTE